MAGRRRASGAQNEETTTIPRQTVCMNRRYVDRLDKGGGGLRSDPPPFCQVPVRSNGQHGRYTPRLFLAGSLGSRWPLGPRERAFLFG